ncbi:hypothetical protein [Sphingobium sp. TCM1]|jgi:hypothetical protein|uniref:hypothetical protein n=1 Tax=Sphingobium sp. TCM1 TaxID=453246 RepID=UPI0007F3597C|nr:hypothetical protein [Sphingobium sp. TCM1]OAN57825.1 hypothetical protein A7Q26_15710 [Sphingobium sp. TCM1]
MSDSPETRKEEAARIRRRWITLGELLAVAAVLISALTLYLNWANKKDERADKAAQSLRDSARAARLVLNGQADGDSRLTLKPTDPGQLVQSQTIHFPTALGIAPVDTTGEPRIEARWFEDALKKARNAAKLPDDSIGDETLPVTIVTQFVVNGDTRSDSAIYAIGYGIAGKWLSGHRLTLRGLSLVGPTQGAGAQAQIDARWARQTKR